MSEIALAVVAAVGLAVALYYAFVLVQRIKLEGRRVSLELQETERLLSQCDAGGDCSQTSQGSKPIIELASQNSKMNFIFLRFIVLFLMLQFWEVFKAAYGLALGRIFLELRRSQFSSVDGGPLLDAMTLLNYFVQYGWVLILVMFGWPLFREIREAAGFSLLGGRK
ncbi:MAG: hypothetical protein AAGF48_12380 [Pseudomonadota bacterium]